MSTIMPPLMQTDPVWRDAKLDWNNPNDQRVMRREHKRIRRQEKRAERQSVIGANQRAFSGRVELGTALRDLIEAGKHVVTQHNHKALRAQFSGSIRCGEHQYRGHFVVLADARAGLVDALGQWRMADESCAEVIWTGTDWRVHIWRASPQNAQTPTTLECSDAP